MMYQHHSNAQNLQGQLNLYMHMYSCCGVNVKYTIKIKIKINRIQVLAKYVILNYVHEFLLLYKHDSIPLYLSNSLLLQKN